jgi:hypothetical protein
MAAKRVQQLVPWHGSTAADHDSSYVGHQLCRNVKHAVMSSAKVTLRFRRCATEFLRLLQQLRRLYQAADTGRDPEISR